MARNPENTQKRRPLATLAIYTPILTGIGVSGYRIYEETALRSNSPAGRVKDTVNKISNRVVEDVEQSIRGHVSAENKELQKAEAVFEALTSPAKRTALAEDPKLAAQAFSATILDPSYRVQGEALEEGIGAVLGALHSGKPASVSGEIVDRIRGLGPWAAAAFEGELASLQQARGRGRNITLEAVAMPEGTLAPRFQFYELDARQGVVNVVAQGLDGSADMPARYGVETRARIENIRTRIQDTPAFQELHQKGFRLEQVGVAEKGGGRGGRWARFELTHSRTPLSFAHKMVFHMPLEEGARSWQAQRYMLLGEHMMPHNLAKMGVLTENGTMNILSGNRLHQSMFENHLEAIAAGVRKTGNILDASRAYGDYNKALDTVAPYASRPMTRGQALLDAIQRNMIYPVEAIGRPANKPVPREFLHRVGDAIGWENVEPMGPNQLGKAGVLDPRIRLGDTTVDIRKIFFNMPYFDRSGRAGQVFRDGNIALDSLARAALGFGAGARGGYDLDPFARGVLEIGARLPYRRGLEFDLIRGVSHTPEMEKLIGASGYHGVQSLTIHFAQDSPAALAFRLAGGGSEGEGIVRGLTVSGGDREFISGEPGDVRAGGTFGRRARSMEEVGRMTAEDLLAGGEISTADVAKMSAEERGVLGRTLKRRYSVEAFGNLLRGEFSATHRVRGADKEGIAHLPAVVRDAIETGTLEGKVFTLEKGQALGISPEGYGQINALNRAGVTERAIIEIDPQTNDLIWRIQQRHAAGEGTKLFGESTYGRVMLDVTEGREVERILEAATTGERAESQALGLLPGLREVATSGSGSTAAVKGRGRFALQEQMVGGLLSVLEDRQRRSGRGLAPWTAEMQEILDVMYSSKGSYGPMGHLVGHAENEAWGAGLEAIEDVVSGAMAHLQRKGAQFGPQEVAAVFGLWVRQDYTDPMPGTPTRYAAERVLGRGTAGKRGTIPEALQWIQTTFGGKSKGDDVLLRREVSHGYAAGIHGMFVGKPPDYTRSIRGAVERRTLETLQLLMQDEFVAPEAKAVYREILSGLVTPEKVSRFKALNLMFDTLTDEQGAAKKVLAEVGDEAIDSALFNWGELIEGWPKNRQVVEWDEAVKKRAKQASADIGDYLFIPSADEMAERTHTRTRQGAIQADNMVRPIGQLASQIQMAADPERLGGREVTDEAFGEMIDELKKTTSQFVVDSHNALRGAKGWNKLTGAAMLKGRSITLPLDEGDKALQAALTAKEVITRREVVEKYGGRMVFIAQDKAEELLDEASVELRRANKPVWFEEAISTEHLDEMRQMFGDKAFERMKAAGDLTSYRKALTSGAYAMPTAFWRHPANRLFSMQHSYVGVMRGSRNLVLVSEVIKKSSDGLSLADWRMIRTGSGGDLDGDDYEIKIFMDKKNVGVLQDARLLGRQGFQAAYAERVLQGKHLGKAMTEGMQAIAREQAASLEGLGPLQRYRQIIKNQVTKMYAAKNEVSRLSNRLTELRAAVAVSQEDPALNIVAALLSEHAEESSTLKMRRYAIPTDFARKLADALQPGTLERKTFSSFGQMIKTVLQAGGYTAGEVLDAEGKPLYTETVEGTKLRVVLPELDELIAGMGRAWGAWVDSPESDYHNAVRQSFRGKLSPEEIVSLVRKSDGNPEQQLAALFASDFGRSAILEQVDKVSLAKRVLNLASDVKLPGKARWMVPLALGIAGTAALGSLVGGPGYAPEPMVPKSVTIDPRVNKAIQDGTLLMASQKPRDISPDSLEPPHSGGGPSANPHLLSPTARIGLPSTHTRIRTQGDHGNAYIDRFVNSMRAHYPMSSVNTRIRDDRNPLAPSQLGGY